MNIDVVQSPPQSVVVQEEGSLNVAVIRPNQQVDVSGSGQQNLFVGPDQPFFTVPGIWVQTGLGDGTDFEVWIEDGN